MNKVILVYPQRLEGNAAGASDISLALLYLSGAIRNAQIADEVVIFDFNTPYGKGKSIEELCAATECNGRDSVIVGINCLYSALFPGVRKTAQALKAYCPNVKIVVGGMHATIFARSIIEHCPEIDAVSIGEGDSSFPFLVKWLFNNFESEVPTGVCTRINGQIVGASEMAYAQDLDCLAQPGYEFFNFEDYAIDTSTWWSPDDIKISNVQVPILTSRSCPNKCNFCSMRLVMGDKFRFRSAENVFNEIQFLYKKYNVNYFKIMDDNFTLLRQRTVDLCNMIIDSGMKLYFDAPNGLSIKTLDEELVSLMRKAGFIMVALAVESGSDYIRNEIIGKKIMRKEIIDAFKHCHRHGMMTKAFFIIGMPEETGQTLCETKKLIEDIEVDIVKLHVAQPFPGTKLYSQCEQDRLFLAENTIHDAWKGDCSAAANDRPYFHMLNDAASNREFWIKPYNMTLEELIRWDDLLRELAQEKSRVWIQRVNSSKMGD